MEKVTKETLTYDIVHFDEAAGQIQVVYGGLPGVPIAVDLYLDSNGLFPTGHVLDDRIRHMAPLEFINRQISLDQGIPNAEEIHKLVKKDDSLKFDGAGDQVPSDLFDVLK